MKKTSEYRQHAEECRALAHGMQREKRDQLIEMAATWAKPFGLGDGPGAGRSAALTCS